MSASIEVISVDQAAGTTAALITAVAGKRIEVTGYCLSVFGAIGSVKSTLQDTTANTVRMTLVGSDTVPAVYSYSGGRHNPAFVTAVGEGLELVTGDAALITGHINYRYI